MKVTKFDAALTYILAGLGLWISYTALADLASRAGLGTWQAHAWPLVVDGLILAATRAVVTFGGHDARRYAWVLLGCAASASIAANVTHALLPDGPVHPAIAAVVAVVPPVAALAMTHLAVVRARVRQDATDISADASPQVVAASTIDAPDPGDGANVPDDMRTTQTLTAHVGDDVPLTPPAPYLVAPVASCDTDRDQRVLDLVAEGQLSGRAIALVVGCSEATVRRIIKAAARNAAA